MKSQDGDRGEERRLARCILVCWGDVELGSGEVRGEVSNGYGVGVNNCELELGKEYRATLGRGGLL